MNKICIWSKCQTRENWQKFTFKIRIWNLNERHVRDTFFFSTARIPFFLTPLCHSSFTVEILYPLFLPYSLFIIGISFSMSEQLFSFFLNFLLHRPFSRIHFIPWILVFPLFYSPRHSPRSFFFFEFFAFLTNSNISTLLVKFSSSSKRKN